MNHAMTMGTCGLTAALMLLGDPMLFGQDSPPPSLYADRKARNVGDVVTILVKEIASATRQSQSQRADNNAVDASGSIEGNLLQFLPVFGLGSQLKTDSQSKEGTSQKDLLTGRISAVITEVNSNGTLKISGSKVININGERNLMTIRGVIRSRDILADNTIPSYQVANSRIYYSKAGIAGRLAKRGSFQRLANVVMGGLGLAIIGYVGGISALTIIQTLTF